jgi:hypothetical protein
MHWSFDIDSRKLTDPLTGLGVRSARLAFPDKYPVTIDLTRGTTPYSFTGNVVLTLRPVMGQAGPTELARLSIPVSGAATASGVLSLATPALAAWIPDFRNRTAILEVLFAKGGTEEVASLLVGTTVARRAGRSPATIPTGNIVVAGGHALNGVYVRTGVLSGKPVYSLNGYNLGYSTDRWYIYTGGTGGYYAVSNAATPDLVPPGSWRVGYAVQSPAPTVTAETVTL